MIKDAEALLETYTLAEILEMNDLTEADDLEFLIDECFVELHEVTPLDFE